MPTSSLRWCARAAIVGTMLGLIASSAHAQGADTRVEWSVQPDLVYASRDGAQSFFLENPTSINFELRIQNDEDSSRAFLLNAGFVRNVDVTLRDADNRIVATNSGWRLEGYCPEGPKCPIGRRMTLRPAQGAVFFGTWVTKGLSPLREGEYFVHIILTPTAAQRYTGTDDGTMWSGLTESPRRIALVLPRADEDRRLIAFTHAVQAQAKGNHYAAWRIYRQLLLETPNDRIALIGAGEALLQLRRFSEAASTLERAVSLTGIDTNPAHGNLRNRPAEALVITYYALRQDTKAEALLRQLRQPNELQQAIKDSKAAATRLQNSR